MKLKLTVAMALAGLVYALLKQVWPDFPITPDQMLTLIIALLTALGIVVTEEQLRAYLVSKGYDKFKEEPKK